MTPIFAVRKGLELWEIWSAATGLLASVRPWEDVAPPSVSTSPIGLDDLMVQHLEDDFFDFELISKSETPIESSELQLVSSQLVNGVLYLMFKRSKWVYHLMEVIFRSGFSGSATTKGANFPVSAAYDVVTYAIALDTGVVSASTATHYDFAQRATRFYSSLYSVSWDFTATETVVPLPLALANSLPSSHPFKDCGQAIWSDVVFAEQMQNYAEINSSAWKVFRDWAHPDLIAFGIFRPSLILGLNTTSELRVISVGFGVRQFSGYQPAENTAECSLYRLIDVPWLDSFDDYSPASITDRDQVFLDLDAMTLEDRELFLTSELEPPAALMAGSSTLATTTDAVYFMEANVMFAYTGSFEFDAGFPRNLYYQIPD